MKDLKFILDSIVWAFITAPAVDEMMSDPMHEHWAETLERLAQNEEIASLKSLLEEIASGGLDHIHKLLAEFHPDDLNVETVIEACRIADKESLNSPGPSLVLGYVAAHCWVLVSSDRLFYEVDRAPCQGWETVPHSLALVALRNGSYDGARRLAELSYDVLMMFYPNDRLIGLNEALGDYRSLLKKINDATAIAIGNLVDDLRAGCELSNSIRSGVAALCWSVGMVPESYAICANRNRPTIPSRRFLRNMVRLTLYCSYNDTLVRYVWLELIQGDCSHTFLAHRNLLNPLLKAPPSWTPDQTFPEPPSRVFARCLIGWFRRETTLNSLRQYEITIHRLLKADQVRNWVIRVRILGLHTMMATQVGIFAGLTGTKPYIDALTAAAEKTINAIRQRTIYPEWPQYYGRPNLPVLQLIELKLSQATGSSSPVVENVKMIMDLIEQVRSAALEYWLRVVLPSAPTNPGAPLKSLLEREESLLRDLRSSYFGLLHNLLPRHYRRFDQLGPTKNSPNLSFSAVPVHNAVLSAELARQMYGEVMRKLENTYYEMDSFDSELARRRRNPSATTSDLVRLVRSHEQGLSKSGRSRTTLRARLSRTMRSAKRLIIGGS